MRDYILKFIFNMKISIAFCKFFKLYYNTYTKLETDKKGLSQQLKQFAGDDSWNGTSKHFLTAYVIHLSLILKLRIPL